MKAPSPSAYAKRRYRGERPLPIEPFREWLASKVAASSKTEVARIVGVDITRIRRLLGSMNFGPNGGYTQKRITYDTVERFMSAFEETPSMIYDL